MLHYLELVYSKNYFNLAKNFLLKAIQNDSKLNRGLSANFCWLRRANHVKFT